MLLVLCYFGVEFTVKTLFFLPIYENAKSPYKAKKCNDTCFLLSTAKFQIRSFRCFILHPQGIDFVQQSQTPPTSILTSYKRPMAKPFQIQTSTVQCVDYWVHLRQKLLTLPQGLLICLPISHICGVVCVNYGTIEALRRRDDKFGLIDLIFCSWYNSLCKSK